MTKFASLAACFFFAATLTTRSATVTTTADNGPGSLRAAIDNAVPGEVITFAVMGVITLTNGELLISVDLNIVGPGPNNLIVQRGMAAPAFRIFNVASGTVGISGLSIRGGEANAGGGINNDDTLALTNVAIVANTALTGGGGGINNNGTVAIFNGLVTSNRVVGPSMGGGGIKNAGAFFATDTRITQNSVEGDAAAGGALHTEAFFSGIRLLIEGNRSVATLGAAEGGGVYNSGSFELSDSTVRGNSANASNSSGSASASGGGILNRDGTVSVTRSTINGNAVLGGEAEDDIGADARGGGVANLFGTTSLTNSTVSGNSAVAGIGANASGRAQGGGVFGDTATTRLFHSTIVSNSVTPFGIDGGGLHASDGTVEIRNTIVAANQAMFDVVSTNDNVFDSAGFNLLGTTTQPLPAGPGDQFNITAAQLKLGPLQNNGGPTFTHALECGSIARDAGGNAGAPPTDQRGAPRIVNGVVDVGAYEAAAASAGSITVAKLCPATAVAPGETLIFTGMVTNSGSSAVTNIVIFNDRPNAATVVTNFDRLEPGEGRTFTGSYPVPLNFTNCQITDTLTAQALDLCGGTVMGQGSNSCTIAHQLTVTCPADLMLQCVSQIPSPNPMTVQATFTAATATVQFSGDTATTNGCVIEIRRRYTVTDSCSNTVECIQNIRVQDTIPPVLAGVPTNEAFQCAGDVPAPPVVTALDNCDGAIPVMFSAVTNGPNPRVIVRTWTAADGCSNRVSASQMITILDTMASTLIGVPTNRTFQCLADLPPPAVVTAQDNCDSNVVVTVTSTTNGTCPIIVIHCWQAVDQSQNVATACQTNVIQDTMAPVLSDTPTNQIFQCAGDVPAPPVVTALDNCDGAIPVMFSAVTNGPNPRVIVRTWTAADGCSNRVSASQTITILDTMASTLIGVPTNRTFQCLADLPPPAVVTAQDNCDSNVVVTVSSTTNGTCPIIVIHCWQAVDQSQNVATACQTNVIQDTMAPVLMGVPTNQTFQCAGDVPAPPAVTALDNCEGAIPVTFSAMTNGPNPRVIVRTWTATDGCSNRVSASQTITILDTMASTLIGVPTNRTFQCLADLPPPAVVTAQDNCDSNVVVTVTSTTNGTCPIIVIHCWQAVDQSQNVATACQTNVIQDTMAPVLVGIPTNQTFQCAGDVPAPPAVTGLDNCDGSVMVRFSAVTNGTRPALIIRTWTAADGCSNQVSASQTITILDTMASTLIGVPTNRTFQCLADVPPPAVVTAQDNCDSSVVVTVTSTTNGTCPIIVVHCWQAVDQSQNVATACQTNVIQDTMAPVLVGVPTNQTFQCAGNVPSPPVVTALDNCDGSVTARFSAVTNGTRPTLIVRTWTAADGCSNQVSASQTIMILDTMASTLIGVPTNRTFQCLADVPPPAVVTAQDNCDSNVVVTVTSTTNGTCPIIVVHCWQAVDQSQNVATACQTNVIQDTMAPVLVGVPTNQTFQCAGNVPAPPVVTALDNCDGSVTARFSAVTNGTRPTLIVRTWTAADGCSNQVSASQSIMILDSTPAILMGVPTNRMFQCLADLPPPSMVTARDNCDSNVMVTVTSTTNGICPIIVIHCWQAVDQNQNVTVACQTNVIRDTVPPVFSGVPPSGRFVNFTEVPAFDSVQAIDNCAGVIPVNRISLTNDMCPLGGITIQTCWMATDPCGNTAMICRTNFVSCDGRPCLCLTKTADRVSVLPGASVNYSFNVTNCGSATLTNVVVIDDNGTADLLADDFLVATNITLLPGQDQTFTNTVTLPVFATCVTNVAIASSRYGVTTLVTSHDAVVCVCLDPRQPGCSPVASPCVTVRKEIACLLPGDQCGTFGKQAIGYKGLVNPAFCYSITISNCGSALLTNLTVFDNQLGDLTADFFAQSGGRLPVRGSVTKFYKMAWGVTATNTVVVVGRGGGNGGTVMSAQDTAVAIVGNASVTCQVFVTSSGDLDGALDNHVQLAPNGPQMVSYKIVLCNPGAVGLSGLMVDPGLPNCGLLGPLVLAAGRCITNEFCARMVDCQQTPLVNVVNVTGIVDGSAEACGRDIHGQPVAVSSQCSALVECQPAGGNPGLMLTKSADKTTVSPGGLVTYTYTIKNIGQTTLTFIEVRDDNGTPGLSGDDFVVGTVSSLIPGAMAELKRTVSLPLRLCSDKDGAETGSLVSEVLSNGNIRVLFVQNMAVNDNTYGVNSIGWGGPGGHKFSNLTGSDQAEFQFKNAQGQVVLQFQQDYISASPNYSAGYGTLGVIGGDGRMVAGSAASVLFVSTSLTENLNKTPFLSNLAKYTVDSPALNDPNSGLWEYRMIYTVIVHQNAFGASGYGSVMIVDQHNSPSKIGGFEPVPCGGCVTNMARAIARSGNTFLTNQAQAVVCGSNGTADAPCPEKSDFWKKNPGQWISYLPNQTVLSVFSKASGYRDASDRSLIEAVDGKAGSGKVKDLLKQAVTALLNVPSSGYPFTTNDIVQGVNMALMNGKDDAFKALTDLLTEANDDKDCGKPGKGGENCDTAGKPNALTLVYNGQSCAQATNSQMAISGKTACTGDPARAAQVRIVASDSSTPPGGGANKFFDGLVNLGGTFVVRAGTGGRFGANTYFYIYQGSTIVQTIQIHTSCSAPLLRGETFGALVLQDYRIE